MSYATNEQVASEFKDVTFGVNTKVTADEVTVFREDAYTYINARIGNKYVTPIPSEAACVAILKQIEVYLVKSRVDAILNVDTGRDEVEDGKPKVDLRKEADKLLKQICDGELRMEGATLRSSQDAATSFNVTEGEEHVFKKGEDQW